MKAIQEDDDNVVGVQSAFCIAHDRIPSELLERNLQRLRVRFLGNLGSQYLELHSSSLADVQGASDMYRCQRHHAFQLPLKVFPPHTFRACPFLFFQCYGRVVITVVPRFALSGSLMIETGKNR